MGLIILDMKVINPIDPTRVDKLLRNLPYSLKTSNKVNGKTVLDYKNVMVNIKESIIEMSTILGRPNFIVKDNINLAPNRLSCLVNNVIQSCEDQSTIGTIVTDITNNNTTFEITIKDEVDLKDIKIFHSDGSVNNKSKVCGYGVCELTSPEEETDTSTNYDVLTESNWHFNTYKGSIDNGTNNIGELSGIEKAVELSTKDDSDKKYYVIVSDSTYGIKCFREWIWNWKKKNYCAANGKPIKNRELIETIQDMLESSDKKVLFGWTKAHVKTFFNEECDKLAKQSVGL